MNAPIFAVDPEWAWSPFEPSPDTPWNLGRAAHLFRRAGFGAGRAELERAVKRGPSDVVAELCRSPSASEHATWELESADIARAMLATGKVESLIPWWIHRLCFSPVPLVEKMTLFWHGHFASSAAKVTDATLMYHQNQLLRRHAIGDFSLLTQEISHDPAMLIYLDSDRNRKTRPNENFARELMELFCLGEGNYTERDVQQLARCFTGGEIRRGRYHFNRYQHDSGTKEVLGEEGRFGSRDGVGRVLEHPAVAEFIVSKLFRHFVCDEPAPPQQLLTPLVNTFREEGLQLRPLLKRMLSSRLFFSSSMIGRKIRSPLELAVGWLRGLEATANLTWLAPRLADLGQRLFFPPSVKGWDGGRAWINSATVVARTNLMVELTAAPTTRFAGGPLGQYLPRHGVADPKDALAWLGDQLIAVPLSERTRQRLLEATGPSPDEPGWRALLGALAAVPETQLN